MSNFQSVKEFNRAFDMVSKEPKNYIGYDETNIGNILINPFKYCRMEIFDKHSIIRLRLNLIKEETKELNDAFIEKGTGFGRTYAGKWPQFRIDYILHDKKLKCLTYKRSDETHTDHYPITAFFER